MSNSFRRVLALSALLLTLGLPAGAQEVSAAPAVAPGQGFFAMLWEQLTAPLAALWPAATTDAAAPDPATTTTTQDPGAFIDGRSTLDPLG